MKVQNQAIAKVDESQEKMESIASGRKRKKKIV